MNDILLKITNGDRTLAQACNHLVYPAAYAPGDSITMTVPEPGYYVIRLDDAMNEELLSFYKYPLMQYVLTIILSLVWISLKGIFISVWYKVWYSSYKKCGTAPACKNK